MNTPVTIPELERRRKRAVEAVREGHKPATVAQVLGVDRGTVYRWLRLARRPGGLDAKPLHRGPALSDRQLREMGDKFEDIEREQFGKDGFEDAVAQIGQIEQTLGFADLARFTAPPPPRA